MIEIWSCGVSGAVGGGFDGRTAERLALSQAAVDGTLRRVVADPGQDFELTPPGDTSPQRLVVQDEDIAAIYEDTVEQGDVRVVAKVAQAVIGLGGFGRMAIATQEEPSVSGTPRLRVYWLVSHKESTPEFDALREHLNTGS